MVRSQPSMPRITSVSLIVMVFPEVLSSSIAMNAVNAIRPVQVMPIGFVEIVQSV